MEYNKEIYKEVYQAMDACNASGILYSVPKWVDAICKEQHELNEGTEYKNCHPIIVLLADKLMELAGHPEDIVKCYEIVRKRGG